MSYNHYSSNLIKSSDGSINGVIYNGDARALLDDFADEDFKDKFLTAEQRNRDKQITRLLRYYICSYHFKIWFQAVSRIILFSACIVIVSVFSYKLISIITKFDLSSIGLESNNLISLISICVTFIISIIGTLNIIVKYCFPENDEQYITEIVKSIQNNDFINKKQNMDIEQIVQILAKNSSQKEDEKIKNNDNCTDNSKKTDDF